MNGASRGIGRERRRVVEMKRNLGVAIAAIGLICLAGTTAQAIAPQAEQATEQTASESKVTAPTAQPAENEQKGPFTSVIIDAQGYGVSRCMSPTIRRPDGSIVWRGREAAPGTVIESGIVAYTESMEAARSHERCGANPLVIKAVAATGPSASDIVISVEDAARLLAENNQTKFLDQFKVIIVKDPRQRMDALIVK
jgi:hypothetical protein